MSKRFTDTDKYKKPFIRSLKAPYKLLWDYLYHDCNHAGIWIKDFDIAQLYIGKDAPINEQEALKYFNRDECRIIPFDDGKKWFIPSFITFQYGKLNPENRAHNSVIDILESNNLPYNQKTNKPLASHLQEAMDKDKDKDKDMDMEKDKNKDISKGSQEGENKPEDFSLNPPEPQDLPLPKEKTEQEKRFDNLKERIHRLYSRRESTEWSKDEIKKLTEVSKRQDSVNELSEIEKFYRVCEKQFWKQNIVTLLNQWGQEVDRARLKNNSCRSNQVYDSKREFLNENR